MIAIAIMVLAFASILQLESSAIEASRRTKEVNVVAMLAKSKMVDVEYEIEGRTFEEVGEGAAGVFEAPFTDYRWEWKVKEMEFPNFSGGQSQDASGGTSDLTDMLSKLITKFFSKALREVTVRVIWKRGTTDQDFSLSTYWVDLNHEFELTP